MAPNAFSYSALISACGRAGRWQQAEALFNELRARAAQDPSSHPNTVTYSALISGGKREDKVGPGAAVAGVVWRDWAEASRLRARTRTPASCCPAMRRLRHSSLRLRQGASCLPPQPPAPPLIPRLGLLCAALEVGCCPLPSAFPAPAAPPCPPAHLRPPAWHLQSATAPSATRECLCLSATAPPPAAAYEKGGQLEKALAAFQQQLRDGVEPDLITYSSLISACERAGAWGGRAAVWCRRVCGCLVKEGARRRLLLGELRGWGMG